MAFWISIGILVPVLLVFVWRDTRSRTWDIIRYQLAFFFAWGSILLATWHFFERREVLFGGVNTDKLGQNSAVGWIMVLGWIPSLILVFGLLLLRRWRSALRLRGSPGWTITFGVFSIVLGGVFLFLKLAWNASAPRELEMLLPRISSVTLLSIPIPDVVGSNLGKSDGAADFQLPVFVRAAQSARYSGVDGRSPEPGFLGFVQGPEPQRVRLGENHFTFESMDGYFTVTGPEGEDYRRHFRAAKEAALADSKVQISDTAR